MEDALAVEETYGENIQKIMVDSVQLIKSQFETLQNAMKIVEGLANLNNRYFPKDGSKANCQSFLEDWIFQIDNSVKCLPEDFRTQMKGIGINFLSVLKNEDGFAPTLTSELQNKWNEFIDKWAEDWELPKDNCIWKA